MYKSLRGQIVTLLLKESFRKSPMPLAQSTLGVLPI